MMKMNTLTMSDPTPWTVEVESDKYPDGHEDGNLITIPEIGLNLYDAQWADEENWERAKANAEFIVQACNNYIRLVESLNSIYIAFHNRDETTSLHVWHERMKEAMLEVKTAFELAGIPVKTKP